MKSGPNWGLWAAFFAAGLGAVYAGLALTASGEVAVLAASVLVGLALLALERVRPQQPVWRAPDGQWWHDLGHFVFSFGLGSFAGAWLAHWLFPEPLWGIWPSRWPLLVQVAVGLVVAELFMYAQHRALHNIPLLWPLHALHHSTERMTFFKATRLHVLDIGSMTFLAVSSLLVLGAPMPVLLWVTAVGNFSAETQHSNVRFRTPSWLNGLVVTPAVHWLHHSIDTREGNSNFGMSLMLFDRLFGTYLPPRREPHEALGLVDNPVPSTFAGQLTMPFTAIRRALRKPEA